MIAEFFLTQFSYYLLTLSSLGTAGVIVIVLRKHFGGVWWLFLAVAFTSLGTSFFLIGSSGSPTGHISRGDVSEVIRSLSLVAGVCWFVWLIVFVVKSIGIRHEG
jgi:hypothetical protein